jgi:tetratricopeptide (TPR) repeat protein
MARQAAKLRPKDSQTHFMLGVIYLMQKNTSSAMQEFRVTTQLDPKNMGAFFNLALLYVQTGDFAKARQAIGRAAVLNPSDPRILGLQANIEEKADKSHGPQKAMALYKKALARDPKNSQFMFALGILYEKTGQRKAALEQYIRVIAREPQFLPAKFNAARMYMADRSSKDAQNNYKKAAVLLREINKAAPNQAEGYTMLGLAELYLGETDSAEAHYKQAQKVDPKNEGAAEGLAYLYERKEKFTEAAEELVKLRNVRPDDVRVYMHLAALYERLGDKKKTAATYQQMVEKFPKDTDAMGARAFYLGREGEKEKAAEQYRAILKLKPDNLTIQMCIAELYASDDDKSVRDKAIPDLQAAKKAALKAKPPKDLRQGDDRLAPFITLASIYEKDGEKAKAAEELQDALKLSPQSIETGQKLAQLYMGDSVTMDKGIEEYRKMIEIEPENQGLYMQLGEAVEKKTPKPGPALEEYRKLIAAKPSVLAPRYVLANALSNKDDQASRDAAIKEYQEILKIKPGEQTALVNMASAYEKSKQPDLAVETLKKAIEKDPTQGSPLRDIARILGEKNDPKATSNWLDYLKGLMGKSGKKSPELYGVLLDEYGKAKRGPEGAALVEAVVKKDPKNTAAMIALAAYYDGAGQKEKAISTYKAAIKTDSKNVQAYKGLGNVYFSQKKYAEALKSYRDWEGGQFFFFGLDEARIRIAQCLEYLGKTDKAIAEYEKLAKSDPNNSEVKDALKRLKPAPLPPPNIPTIPGPGTMLPSPGQ